jgi:hypothetical protein
MNYYDLTKDELLSCIIEVFSQKCRITEIDTTTKEAAVRLTVDGNRLQLNIYGDVESVGEGMLIGDFTAKLVEMLVKPAVNTASNMKLAA